MRGEPTPTGSRLTARWSSPRARSRRISATWRAVAMLTVPHTRASSSSISAASASRRCASSNCASNGCASSGSAPSLTLSLYRTCVRIETSISLSLSPNCEARRASHTWVRRSIQGSPTSTPMSPGWRVRRLPGQPPVRGHDRPRPAGRSVESPTRPVADTHVAVAEPGPRRQPDC